MDLIELVWDSNFFGYPIAKIYISRFNKFSFNEFKFLTNKYKLIYIYSEEDLFEESLKKVDDKVTFEKNLSIEQSFICPNPNIQNFDNKIHDQDQLIRLALESGLHSRFNIDSNFKNNEFYKLYNHWILNSISGDLAFNIQVYVEGENILGFSTLARISDSISTIGLIAVDKNHRGKKIASKLIESVAQISEENNFKTIQVSTQGANIPAINLYSRLGFTIVESIKIYHYWNL